MGKVEDRGAPKVTGQSLAWVVWSRGLPESEPDRDWSMGRQTRRTSRGDHATVDGALTWLGEDVVDQVLWCAPVVVRSERRMS